MSVFTRLVFPIGQLVAVTFSPHQAVPVFRWLVLLMLCHHPSVPMIGGSDFQSPPSCFTDWWLVAATLCSHPATSLAHQTPYGSLLATTLCSTASGKVEHMMAFCLCWKSDAVSIYLRDRYKSIGGHSPTATPRSNRGCLKKSPYV
jgi:hypothetical protein